jgi:hypothetical protein
MNFIITINCDNAAFQDNEAGECIEIIKDQILTSLESGEMSGMGDKINLRDYNGNNVGEAKFTK